MVDTTTGFEDGAPPTRTRAAHLQQLRELLLDALATPRARHEAPPTVRQLARRLGVDTDLVLLALGTIDGARSTRTPVRAVAADGGRPTP